MNSHRSLHVLFLTAFGVMCWAGTAGAQAAPKKGGSEAVDWTTKRIAWDVRAKPWASVLDWFSDEAQMPLVVGRYRLPEGSFDFVNPKPKGKPTKYSLIEIFDIINEVLVADHNFLLLSREKTLMLLPADDPRLNYLTPRIKLADLLKHGQTEIVEVVFKLDRRYTVEDLQPPGRRPYGDPISSVGDGQFRVRTNVATLVYWVKRFAISDPNQGTGESPSTNQAVAPPASPPPPATACCESAPRCRAGLPGRLLRR